MVLAKVRRWKQHDNVLLKCMARDKKRKIPLLAGYDFVRYSHYWR